ncbi:RNA polymerase sigma factor [Acidocella aquatica]|uniref:RNA polymerase sigma factor n=2 Tax=Acidocella aquatica TaxID=1922313 RepID=A0ABQ6A8X9_9PROT|nr:RNA polymerase sigma factor [Acidocella aquatica]
MPYNMLLPDIIPLGGDWLRPADAILCPPKGVTMAEENPDWRIWLAAAQLGDARAYARVLQEALPWLRRRARARWPQSSAADIEDMVQETLLALHQSRHLYDPSRPVAPFLFGILKFRGAEIRRRRQRHAGRETAIDDVPVTSTALATNDTQDRDVDTASMMMALKGLGERDKLVLNLLKVRQLSLREAATETGMSVVALKVATFRAMQRLKKAMKENVTHED